jgi:hypothetical protein
MMTGIRRLVLCALSVVAGIDIRKLPPQGRRRGETEIPAPRQNLEARLEVSRSRGLAPRLDPVRQQLAGRATGAVVDGSLSPADVPLRERGAASEQPLSASGTGT